MKSDIRNYTISNIELVSRSVCWVKNTILSFEVLSDSKDIYLWHRPRCLLTVSPALIAADIGPNCPTALDLVRPDCAVFWQKSKINSDEEYWKLNYHALLVPGDGIDHHRLYRKIRHNSVFWIYLRMNLHSHRLVLIYKNLNRKTKSNQTYCLSLF